MADDDETIDSALKELARLGQRITELAGTFEAHREATGRGEDRPDENESAESADHRPAQPSETARNPAAVEASIAPAGGGAFRKPRRTSKSGHRRRSSATAARSRKRRRRGNGTWTWSAVPKAPVLVSTTVHAAALIVLALLFIPGFRRPEPVAIISGEAAEEWQDDLAAVEVESLEQAAAEQDPVEQDAAEEFEIAAPPEFTPSDPLATLSAAAATDPFAGPSEPFAADASLAPSLGDLLASLGGSGAEAGGGAGPGGEGAGDGMTTAATFFGRRGTGKTALFMCDNSASYLEGGFQAVLIEISRAVGLMKPNQSFHIVFFSDAAYPLFHPDGIETFLPATPDNKRKLDAWLGTVELCIGGQGIRGAASLAAALEPDVIYFLSDGDHAESVIDRMVSLSLGDTVVHTFGMQFDVRDRTTNLPDPRKLADQQERNAKLMRIAAAHGGTFTPVTISPQAARSASVRPVKKNRVRGAIWGTNLPAAP